MEIFKRQKYLGKIKKSLEDKSKILFLIWPRQAGKTTLLKSLTKFWIISEQETLFLEWNLLQEEWIELYKDLIAYLSLNYDLSKIKYLIIDEGQLVPNLGNILFQFINEIRNWKFDLKIIVSGSGSLNIFKNITDSLVWRKEILNIWPFDFEEFVQAKWKNFFFSDSQVAINQYLQLWQEYVLWGGYPKVVLSQNYEEKFKNLKDIYSSYLEKDIRYLLDEKDILHLKKILFEIGKRIGSQITFADIVESVGIKRYAFEKILFVLENTFIVQSLKPFVSGKFEKEVKKKEKIYFVDFGILRFILDYTNVDLLKPLLVENFVFNQQLFNQSDYIQLYFWGKYNEVEIDFIRKNLIDGKIQAIDAKITKKDNIPKSYLNFCKQITNFDKFVITTENLVKARQEECEFEFIPYVYILRSENFEVRRGSEEVGREIWGRKSLKRSEENSR